MKSVTFEVSGRELCLRFDFNALARYQERAGESVIAAARSFSRLEDGDFDYVRTRRLFWAGLNERTTEDGVGEIIEALGADSATLLLLKALNLGLGITEPSADEGRGVDESAGNAQAAKMPPKPKG